MVIYCYENSLLYFIIFYLHDNFLSLSIDCNVYKLIALSRILAHRGQIPVGLGTIGPTAISQSSPLSSFL